MRVILCVIAAFLISCSHNDELELIDYLEVWSGGSHVAEYGTWTAIFDTGSTFRISYIFSDSTTSYPNVQLTTAEHQELWALLDKADIQSLKSSTRAGVPDEVMTTYIFGAHGSLDTLKIWQSDARKNDALLALLNRIKGLISKYTAVDPIVF